jgi:hypothetical protein
MESSVWLMMSISTFYCGVGEGLPGANDGKGRESIALHYIIIVRAG